MLGLRKRGVQRLGGPAVVKGIGGQVGLDLVLVDAFQRFTDANSHA
jgi:hypothetical protein